jgi:hypothetical protein
MLDVTAPEGHFPTLRFDDTISVASNSLEVEIDVEEDHVYKPIADSTSLNNSLYQNKNVGPGTVTKYNMKLTNTSNVEQNVSVVLSEITASIIEMYDFIYIGIFSTSGFYFPYESPATTELSVKESLPSDYVFGESRYATINFIDYFAIPPATIEPYTVQIKFYIRIDYRADNRLQEQNFSIGKINFVSI